METWRSALRMLNILYTLNYPHDPVLDTDGVKWENKAAQIQQGQIFLETILSCELLSWIMRHGPSSLPQYLPWKDHVWPECSIGAMVLSVARKCPADAWSTLPLLHKAFLWLWRSPSSHSLAGVTHQAQSHTCSSAHTVDGYSRRRQLWGKTNTDATGRHHCVFPSNRHTALFLIINMNITHTALSRTLW